VDASPTASVQAVKEVKTVEAPKEAIRKPSLLFQGEGPRLLHHKSVPALKQGEQPGGQVSAG
jgi:hypothetical protein